MINHPINTQQSRVEISYEIETGNSIEKKELPYVIGLLGDFAGDNDSALGPISEREFIEINEHNFEQVMSEINPMVNLEINDELFANNKKFLQLQFKQLDDFKPENLANQIPELNELLSIRKQLSSLLVQSEIGAVDQSMLSSVASQLSSILGEQES